MMVSMRSLFCAAVVWVAVASEMVQDERSLSVGASGQIRSKPVVRKVQSAKNSAPHLKPVIRKVARMSTERSEGQERSHVSTFAGLVRVDRYVRSVGVNCSSGHGGGAMNSVMDLTLGKCQEACAHDDECTCVSYEAASKTCRKQRYCHVEDCVPSSLVDTYTLHSTFKVPRGHRAGNVAASGNAAATVPQASFERSGGRMCTNATQLESINVGTAPDVHLSVTQCLTRCLQNPACTCVKYERYYQSECFLMANCEQPNFCTRSNKYDTYVTTGVPSPAPQACSFQCSPDTSADCMDEYVNAKTTGQLPAFFSRCETEGGSAPLRSRCKLCCEACTPGAHAGTANTRTCNFQCGQQASADCKTEFANSKVNGDLTPFHARCETEGGSSPLRSRCNLCCDGCLPNINTTTTAPQVGAGCCTFGGSTQCADCGTDGSGFCHQFQSNCEGACAGTWSPTGNPPTCPQGGNAVAAGCCTFGGSTQCADCGTDGSGFCHQFQSNCEMACGGNWNAAGVPPAKCPR